MLLTRQNPVTGQLRRRLPVGMRGLTHWWPLSNKFNDKTITRPAAGSIYGVNTSVLPIGGPPFGSDGGGSAFFSANPSSILLSQAPHGFGSLGPSLNPFSICGWVNLGSLTSRDSSSARFVCWQQPTGESNNQIIVGTAIGGAADGALCVHLVAGGTTLIAVSANSLLTTGQWYHWAATWDGVSSISNILGYLNGVPVSLGSSGGFFSVTANNFAIGARDVSGRSLNGQLADIRYHRGTVLTPAEIAAIYQDGLTAEQEPPFFVGVSGTSTVNLTGRAAVLVRALSAPALAAGLAGRVTLAARSRPSFAGQVSLAGTSKIMTAVRASPALAVGLAGRVTVAAKSRLLFAGQVSLAGTSKIITAARAVPPGAIALVAAAFIRIRAGLAPQGATSLQARAQVSGRATAAATASLPLQGRALARSRAMGAATASALLQARSRIGVAARAPLSVGAALAALAGRVRVRVSIRGVLGTIGGLFVLSPRNVAPAAPARTVQVAGESRSVIAIDDGRSAEPGSS